MQKVALLLLFILLVCRASAANSIPLELVGEWRNSTNSTNFDQIIMEADGTGFIGEDANSATYDVLVSYNSINRELTLKVVHLPQYPPEKKYPVFHFLYDPIAKTLVDINSDWPGKMPFVHPPEKSLIPASTLSPDHRYGVTVPIFYFDDTNDVSNTLIEVKTGKVLTSINAEVGYDRALNFLKVGPTRWSKDSSILLWKVEGKWMDEALVLIKIKDGKAAWQLDLLKTAQQAILTRTKKAALKTYLTVKGDGNDYGSAYPDGFTVPVYVKDALTFPIIVHAHLTANPKDIENYPNNLDSQLVGSVDENGKFTVTKFALTTHKEGE